MKYTNKLNLPEVFVNIYKNREEREPQINRFSVTELLKPTQEILLTRKYYKELEEDISECIPTLFGSAVHKVFEENSNPDESEVKLEIQIGEDTIVGIIDHVKDDEIQDYKTCTSSKVSKKDFSDHEMQIKIYALMRFKKYGVITRKGKLFYLIKDWSKIKSSVSSEYPKSPIYVHEFDITDSDYDLSEKYIKNKLNEIHNNIICNCTEEDTWYTGTTYAVYKNVGDKRAAYTTEDEQDAHNYISNKLNGAGEIQVRKGKHLKCELYCNVNKFCEQYNSYLKQ